MGQVMVEFAQYKIVANTINFLMTLYFSVCILCIRVLYIKHGVISYTISDFKMAQRDKRLKKWKTNTPKTAKRSEVEGIIDYYFSGNYSWESGSHIVLQHDALKQISKYQPYGEYTIPVSHGKEVKGRYIKELVAIIEILGLWNEKE